MTAIDQEALKAKIKLEISFFASSTECIIIPGGSLIQAISNDPKDAEEKIFQSLTKLHQSLPEGQNAFPFQIYVYIHPDDAFKEQASLKTKAHDYASGHHTTYLMAQDAIIKMREIDVDALVYGVNTPFEFIAKNNQSEGVIFNVNPLSKYKELDVAGGHYNLDNGKIEPEGEDRWKITLI